MKINYLSVNNFRGISGGLENNKIIFENSNTIFLFGQNNAGKSTFLHAYQFFFDDKTPTINDFNNKNDSEEMIFEMEMHLEDIDIKKIEQKAPKQKDSFKEYLTDNKVLKLRSVFVKDSKSKIAKKSFTWHPQKEHWEEKGYASVGLHSVFQSCMPKPIFIKAMPNEDEAKNILNEILKAIAESKLKDKELQELHDAQKKIQELQDKMYKPETINNYQDSINEYFEKLFPDTSLSIIDKKSKLVWSENKLGKEFDIEFKKLDSDGNINSNIPTSINSIGHGTIRSAIFTLLLMKDIAEEFERHEGRKDYMVLFEEPELFLYPRIMKQLRDLIYQVSEENLPYQVLCASHSPQMIDISKPKSSIIRLIKDENSTKLYQINDSFLKTAKEIKTDEELKQEMYEILRFNPHICESFYADEVILVEGPTEELILRAYLQETEHVKDIFILNCGSINNMPFYQKIFSKFSITYNVICDTDKAEIKSYDENNNPKFDKYIQGSISKLFDEHKKNINGNTGLFRVHNTTFEPAHQQHSIKKELRLEEISGQGKPYNANKYWRDVIHPNLMNPEINNLPIIRYIKEIMTNV